jgi:SHS2 domain-containing protein
MGRWEHFSHGSDVGVRGFGSSIEEAFEQAGVGLTAIVADPSTVQTTETVEIACDAPDLDLLFVSWLDAIIYEMAVRKMLFRGFHVAIEGRSLTATLTGEKVDPGRHELAVEAKGATVTALMVQHHPDGQWMAQCVVDV